MIRIHELLTRLSGNNPEIWLGGMEAEAMRDQLSENDRTGHQVQGIVNNMTIGTFTGAPAQSTMIRAG